MNSLGATIVPYDKRIDGSYWNMSIAERTYLRLLYSVTAFITVGSFFDIMSPASPVWFQVITGGIAGATALTYRMRHPDGMEHVLRWMLEAMDESADDRLKRGVAGADKDKQDVANALDALDRHDEIAGKIAGRRGK